MWAIQARSITTRRNTRTKSGSSWNLYQEYARHWRIAEKSRVNGRGVFKKKIYWRLWGSNFILPGLECQDSLHPWRQRREDPDAEIDDEHTRNSLASPLYLQGREASASLLQVHYSQKRKLVSRCTVNFSKYGATRRLDVTKVQIWPRVRHLSDQDLFWKDKGTIARKSKIRDPETWIQSGSCRK